MNAFTATSTQPDIDFLGIGELLVDFIADEAGVALDQVGGFRRHLGGSPANIAINIARLGGRSALIARVGEDALGQFLRRELQANGVLPDFVQTDAQAPTSVVFLTRGLPTPQFLAIRGADARLSPGDISVQRIVRARVIHASAFALASATTRQAIEFAFNQAHELGKIISFDPNYSPLIWPDREEALDVMAGLYPLVTVTKPSLDDARRLFGHGHTPEAYIERFHQLGAATVILSMGVDGVLVSEGGATRHIPAHPLPVVDVTGAGDAFWAGFLMALLDGHPLDASAQIGQIVAEIKLQRVGPLPADIDLHRVYERWARLA